MILLKTGIFPHHANLEEVIRSTVIKVGVCNQAETRQEMKVLQIMQGRSVIYDVYVKFNIVADVPQCKTV